jgi:hypothetical protein
LKTAAMRAFQRALDCIACPRLEAKLPQQFAFLLFRQPQTGDFDMSVAANPFRQRRDSFGDW